MRDSFGYITGYCAEGPAVCMAKCDVLYGDAAKAKCHVKHPCLRDCSKSRNKDEKCCKNIKSCKGSIDSKRASCKKGCEEKGKAGGILGTGVGSGRRKACSELGLSGAEKRDCARELRARGWKKGLPIPDDMAGLDDLDIEQYEPDIEEATDEEKDKAGVGRNIFWDERTKKFLIYSGAAIGVVGGIYVIIRAVRSLAVEP